MFNRAYHVLHFPALYQEHPMMSWGWKIMKLQMSGMLDAMEMERRGKEVPAIFSGTCAFRVKSHLGC